MTWRRKLAYSLAAAVIVMGAVAVLVLPLVLRMPQVQERLRQLIVSRVAQATGTPVELKSVAVQLFPPQVELDSFVLHGTEPAGEEPLFQAKRIVAGTAVFWRPKGWIYLQSLRIEEPRINIVIFEDGRNNFPKPKRKAPGRPPFEVFVSLGIRHFEMSDGVLQFAERRIPLDFRGKSFHTELTYDLLAQRYSGRVSMRPLLIQPPGTGQLEFDAATALTLEKNRLEIHSITLAKERSRLRITCGIADLRKPHLAVSFDGTVSLAELGRPLKLPLEPRGEASLRGRASLWGGLPYEITGHITGRGLAYRDQVFQAAGLRGGLDFRVASGLITADNFQGEALGGTVTGAVRLERLRHFAFTGEVRGISLPQLAAALPVADYVGYTSTLSGPVKVGFDIVGKDIRRLKAAGEMQVEAMEGESQPAEGFAAFSYDHDSRTVELTAARLSTLAGEVSAEGTLPHALRFDVQTSDIVALLAEMPRFRQAPPPIPVRFLGGKARATGVLSGAWDEPAVAGHMEATQCEIQGVALDRLEADYSVSSKQVSVSNLRALRDRLSLSGRGRVSLSAWQPSLDSSISSVFSLRVLEPAQVFKELGRDVPLAGDVAAEGQMEGTVRDPAGEARVTMHKGAFDGEPFEAFEAKLTVRGRKAELESLQLRYAGGSVRASGSYERESEDWKNGTLAGRVQADGVQVARLQRVIESEVDAAGVVAADLEVRAAVRGGTPRLTALSGSAAADPLEFKKTSLGSLRIQATTRGQTLTVEAAGKLAGSAVEGRGEWQLVNNYAGRGSVRVERLDFAALAPFFGVRDENRDKPSVTGHITAQLEFSGPVLDPAKMQAHLTVSQLEAGSRIELGGNGNGRVYLVRNAGPLRFRLENEEIRVERATLLGEDTELELLGRVNLAGKSPLDLKLKGSLNLRALQALRPGFLPEGVSSLDASIRGEWTHPEILGRLELHNASFYLEGVPNGIEKVNGLVVFDGRRATIERLEAASGGGKLTARGFAQYVGGELAYRVQLSASGVRVRYPEGVSTTFDAGLNLDGTGANSVLSGDITVLRANINPRLDVGGLLAQAGKATPAPSPNVTLRGMQLRLNVRTAPGARLETSLTRDIEAEGQLFLRGSPVTPSLLGRVLVNEGEINFFGNRYTINRGEITFVNPVRIEPVLNLDLETRVRQVDVNLTFSGPINKLSISYRSDPPLQLSEILSLLASGRAPASDPNQLASQSRVSQNWQQIGADTLIVQALTSPVTNRIERLFGISRVRIDPQLTGVDQQRQARIIVEQQVSRDVTFMYSNNLAGASQGQTVSQTVGLEWVFSRRGSVVVATNEYGRVGADVYLRKRF